MSKWRMGTSTGFCQVLKQRWISCFVVQLYTCHCCSHAEHQHACLRVMKEQSDPQLVDTSILYQRCGV